MFLDWYPLGPAQCLALFTTCFLLYKVSVWRKSSLSNVPYHKFDQDDTPLQYIQNSEALLHSGYLKVSPPSRFPDLSHPIFGC